LSTDFIFCPMQCIAFDRQLLLQLATSENITGLTVGPTDRQ